MSAPLPLRVRINDPTPKPISLDPSTTYADFLGILEGMSGIPAAQIKLLRGLPPKPVSVTDASATIGSLFKPNEPLIVQKGEATLIQGHTDGKYVPPCGDRTRFVRREMPGDGNCLFHSAAYVLEDKSTGLEAANKIRQKIADYIQSHPAEYPPAILGTSSVASYISALRQASTWGGGIELAALSDMYKTEFIALDLESSNILRFGVDKNYSVRGYVAYSGKHYDALAMTPYTGSMRDDQVLFNPRDTKVEKEAKDFVAAEGKRKRG